MVHKTSKARKTASSLQFLPLTDESFKENVKRTHLQAMVWYATMKADPPAVDSTLYGWKRDELNKVLLPIDLPESIVTAPDELLNTVKFGCSASCSSKPKQCLCATARRHRYLSEWSN